MKLLTKSRRWFERLALLNMIAIFMLIIIGGVVRITGSGMGCPDWPKCFGHYVPPTSISDLPEHYLFKEKNGEIKDKNYREMYAEKGYAPDGFPLLTWIEYINRLWSVVIVGPIMLLTLIFSFSWFRRDKSFSVLAVIMLGLSAFVGWLGKLVVDYHLDSLRVTAHLLPALLVFALSIIIWLRALSYKEIANKLTPNQSHIHELLLLISFAFFMAQLILGTLVRGDADSANAAHIGEYLSEHSIYFTAHRIFSLLVTATAGWFSYLYFKSESKHPILSFSVWTLLACIIIQTLSGTVLAFSAKLAGSIRLVHLVAGSAMFGAYVLILSFRYLRAKSAPWMVTR